MKRQRARAHSIRTHASKSLRLNLRILGIVYSVLLCVTLYSVVVSQAIFWQVVVGAVIGGLAGVISARMYKISWDKDQAQVIGRIDLYGIVVMVAFIVFEGNRTAIAQLFTSGEAIGAIGLVLVTAALFGRILATSRQIIRILRAEKIIFH